MYSYISTSVTLFVLQLLQTLFHNCLSCEQNASLAVSQSLSLTELCSRLAALLCIVSVEGNMTVEAKLCNWLVDI